MRGMNKKGFILTETLVVSVVLLVSFTFVFTQFLTIFASYKLFENYKDIDALYASINIERFITQDNMENLTNRLEVNKLDGKPYYEFTNCQDDVFSFFNQCISIINNSNIAKAFIVDYDLSNLIGFNYDNNFSYELKKYIEFLNKEKETNLIGNYRIIIEMKDGSFASRIVNPTIAVPSKEQYRYKNGYINLNGTSQDVTINKPIPNNVTIEMWATANNYTDKILWGIQSTVSNNLNLYFSNNRINLSTEDDSANYFAIDVLPSLGEWHHYAVTFDNTNSIAKLYIDSKYVGTALTYKNPIGTSFRLGRWFASNDYYWEGNIKEVKVWDKVLNPIEINDSMHNINSINDSNNLLYYYKMSEGIGTTLYDYSGNNNNLPDALANAMWQTEINFSDWIDSISTNEVYSILETRTLYFYKNHWYTEVELEQLL